MTKSQIQDLDKNQWNESGGFLNTTQKLDIIAGLSNTSVFVTPSIDNIKITYYK
ncbi:hypothetical protein D3C71_2167300 [compost metagenome]